MGADGVRSITRQWVGGQPLRYSGTSAFRGIVPVERLNALPDPQAIQFWIGQDAICCIMRSAAMAGTSTSSRWWRGPPPGPVAAGRCRSNRGKRWRPSPTGIGRPANGRGGRCGASLGPVCRAAASPLASRAGRADRRCRPCDAAASRAGREYDDRGCHHAGDHARRTDVIQPRRTLCRLSEGARAAHRLIQRSSWDANRALHTDASLPDATRHRAMHHFPERYGWIHKFDASAQLSALQASLRCATDGIGPDHPDLSRRMMAIAGRFLGGWGGRAR